LVIVVFLVLVIFFFAIVLIVFFVIGLLPMEGTVSYPRRGLAGIWGLALMRVELRLKARLRIGSPFKAAHRNFEFSAAKGADGERRGGAQPFDDSQVALEHRLFFLGSNHA
jgi:hypothetical protein